MADEKQETIEDVVRKIRNEIVELRKVSPNVPSIAADWWEARADEIEAAHKREAGDAAKLREALGYILKYADSAACRDHDEHTRHYIDQIRKWAQSALASPARNCDNYATDDKAIAFFADEALLEEWEALKLGKDRDMLATELFSFIRWLFATATEEAKEGENK